jgi:hypothetical protein
MDNQKALVPILVFEDTPLYSSRKLRERVDLPKARSAAGVEFVFNWHPIYNAMGALEDDAFADPVLMRSIEEYRNAVSFLRDELKGPAILFFDMTFSEPGSTLFSIEDSDITDHIVKFVECYTGEATDVSRAKSFLNPEMLGFTLAATAASNPNWYGVITFASKQVDVDLQKIEKCLANNTQILWRNLRASLAADGLLAARAEYVDTAIDAFVKRREGPSFWPPITNDWFRDDNFMPPHDVPKSDFNYEAAIKVKEYLSQLLPGFILPSRWFRDPEWPNLYEVLKGMIGYHSAAEGNEKVDTNNLKNLRLGAVPLLLAAQMSWKQENIDWFQSYVWDRGRLEIMAHDKAAFAQEAIRALAVFLKHLSIGKDGSNQVCGATWSPVTDENPTPHLWLDFRMDPMDRRAGRGLLPMLFRAPWGGSKGQTVLAYERMMKLAQPQPNAPPFFSLCVYPHIDEENRVITRLDFCQVEQG